MIVLALGLLILAATRAYAAPGDALSLGRATDPEDSEDGATEDDGADLGASEEDSEGEPSDSGPVDVREGEAERDREDDRVSGTARERGEDVDELAEPDRLADLVEDAAVDDPLLRDAIETGVVFQTAFADAVELADLASRHQRPSRFGRVDLTLAWRRGYHVVPIGVVLDGPRVARDSTTYEHRIDDTFLVVATWRI